jgi:hypothetical protein
MPRFVSVGKSDAAAVWHPSEWLLVLLVSFLQMSLMELILHHGIWPVAQIAHADLSGFDNGSGSSIIMHNTPVLLDGLFGYYYYIPI